MNFAGDFARELDPVAQCFSRILDILQAKLAVDRSVLSLFLGSRTSCYPPGEKVSGSA
jgi:hypothetical protein